MDEHNEYLLQVYGGVFEILLECSSWNMSYFPDLHIFLKI